MGLTDTASRHVSPTKDEQVATSNDDDVICHMRDVTAHLRDVMAHLNDVIGLLECRAQSPPLHNASTYHLTRLLYVKPA